MGKGRNPKNVFLHATARRNVSTTLIQPGSEFKLCWETLVQSCCSLRDGGKRKRDRTPPLPKRRKTVGGPQARFASLCDGLRPSLTAARRLAPGTAGRDGGMVFSIEHRDGRTGERQFPLRIPMSPIN